MVSFGWPLALLLLPMPLLLGSFHRRPRAEVGLPIPPLLAQAFDSVAVNASNPGGFPGY